MERYRDGEIESYRDGEIQTADIFTWQTSFEGGDLRPGSPPAGVDARNSELVRGARL